MAANATKKSFTLRMSKKVAELTQVVHMLFMKHHEKELELEALKDAYEHEIDLVIADARGQLDALTRKLEDREERLRATKPEMEKEKGSEEDQKKIEALEKSLEVEKAESQRMRDQLTLSKNDIETQHTLNAQQLSEHSEHMSEKSKEIELLKLHVADLERLTRYSESQTSHLVDSLRKTVETLSGQTTQLREELSNSENLRESLTNRSKNLEDDVKRLKRELAKRSSLPDVDNARQQNVPANTETIMRKPNYDREIQRLKQEIQRYRMELTNRETNYNRRFADSQPILVHRRPINDRTSSVANGHSSKNAELFNDHHGNPLQSSVHAGQERARTGRKLREAKHQSYSDDLVSTISTSSVSPSMVRSTSSITSERLPQLDSRLSIRRPVLAKPQPSKHLLSKKSTNWMASHV